MNMMHLLWEALKFILLAIQIYLRELVREEGRQDIRNQQEAADAAAQKASTEIDASVAGADLDDLRDRMRHHQRPPSAL